MASIGRTGDRDPEGRVVTDRTRLPSSGVYALRDSYAALVAVADVLAPSAG